jgi:TolA-binding protein
MRGFFLLVLLSAGLASEAAAQQPQTIDRRVGRLEQDMRAVQRRVFPDSVPNVVEPELQPRTTGPSRPIGETGDAITTLSSRIEALEAQLARVTGQVEENGYRLGQLEEQVRQLRSDLGGRIERLERAAAPPPVQQPVEPIEEPVETGNPPATPGGAQPLDPVQDAYNRGFRLWEARRFAEAATALTEVADRNPRSPWASWARNLAGRAYLDDNKPATAAQVFLRNYQDNPRGERAADSLFFLGEALVALNRHAEACPVYTELQTTYPNMRAFLRERLPAARRTARCR